jgi:hypothetical protein
VGATTGISFIICTYATADCKGLPRPATPFDSALTKNTGEGSGAPTAEGTVNRSLLAVPVLFVTTICLTNAVTPGSKSPQDPCAQSREEWVRTALIKIKAIKPGMTRQDLLEVFRTEGGFSVRLHRQFVSRDCPYFKVDIDFRAAGRADEDDDKDGRITTEEDPNDVIVRISQPYLQFSIAD